jgi:BirA family transcriptional regulator, biotin operon repressor / biotin---[acetyl-CoA-carboxylase] ligase
MKGRILNILRAESGIVSGETISSLLGISRVSIWKHIHKLLESGYDIRSTPTGYQLVSSPDALYPWEFPEREKYIHYYDEVYSTMDIARDLARKGCSSLTVVIAGSQTNGRGRLKRNWLSDKGGIYFTVVIRPGIPLVMSSKVNFMASIVLVKTLRDMFGIDAAVKWPNDILAGGKKLSGMLSEMEAEGDMVSFINIGIGINVNNEPFPKEPMSTSLKRLVGRNVSRKDILNNYLNTLENKINEGKYDDIINEWKKNTSTLNREVKIVTTSGEFYGTAVDIDENGSLVLKQPDGKIKTVLFGDCFHQ